MPSKSKSQQRLFGMALAVRNGELERSEVSKEVLEIVDGDMTDKEISDFAKHRTSDKEHSTKVDESLDLGIEAIKRATKVSNRFKTPRYKKDTSLTPIENYLNTMVYAGRMHPVIDVRPDFKYVFAVIKPGFSKLASTVIERFEKAGFKLYKTRTKMLSLREAKTLYGVHKDEEFYDDLCKYMSSDLSIGMLFAYPSDWTSEKAFKKTDRIKDSVRDEFKESDMRNVMHSSDNVDNMRLETSMYFNELV